MTDIISQQFGSNQDYTSNDFETLLARLQSLTGSVFPGWTEATRVGFANVLRAQNAFVGDVLCYLMNNKKKECHWGTLSQRHSAINMGKLISYRLGGATPAQTEVVFRAERTILPGKVAGSVYIPEGVICRTSGTNIIRQRSLSAVTIAAGSAESSIVMVENSTEETESFPANGKKFQELVLGYTPFVEGEYDIYGDSSHLAKIDMSDSIGPFETVDSFLDSRASDAHAVVLVDENNKATVRIGDGQNGRLANGTITVAYKYGGGEAGRVEAEQLTVVENGPTVDSNGNPVVVTCFNENASIEGTGTDRETVAYAKQTAPASSRVGQYTIAKEDYVFNAKRVAGVARALCLTNNEEAAIPNGRVRVYIVPEGGGQPASALISNVETMLQVTRRHTVTAIPEVMSVTPYLNIDVYAVVYLRPIPAGYTRSEYLAVVRDQIETALEDFFIPSLSDGTENPNVDFGANYKDINDNIIGEIAWSDILNEVRDAGYVRKVGSGADEFLLNGERDDVFLFPYQFPAFGEITLIDGDSGEEF